MGARAATCVAPASVVQGAGTMALHHTCRALTAPLAFHRYVAPVVTALEETAGPRFGAWTTYVRVSSALRPALAAFLASSSPAALRCRLVNATSGAAVAVGTATLMAENDDPDAASRVQCALGSDLEPLPAGPHAPPLSVMGSTSWPDAPATATASCSSRAAVCLVLLRLMIILASSA